MNDTDYIHIESWMGKRLGLRGNLLLCFALIHGYSRNGNGVFKGGLKYICDMLFCSEPTALSCLDKLIELELICKSKAVINGHERSIYYVCVKFDNGELVCFGQTKETLVGQTKETLVGQTKETLVGQTKETLVGNKYNRIKNNNKEKRLSNDNQKVEYSDDFLEFWEAYGYSKDKGTTYKRWCKLSKADREAALKSLPQYFEDCQRNKRSKQYPATYLNKRTWEDDLSGSSDSDITPNADEIPAADIEPWESTKKWMRENVPSIAEKISYRDFADMRGYACFNSKLFADTLKRIHESGYDSEIVKEFKRLVDEV